jgi:hypothetical protein
MVFGRPDISRGAEQGYGKAVTRHAIESAE